MISNLLIDDGLSSPAVKLPLTARGAAGSF